MNEAGGAPVPPRFPQRSHEELVRDFNVLCTKLQNAVAVGDGQCYEGVLRSFANLVLQSELSDAELADSNFIPAMDFIVQQKKINLQSDATKKLVKKLVKILEHIERFTPDPSRIEDLPKKVSGTVPLEVYKAGDSDNLKEKSGKHLRVELLARVRDIRKFVYQRVQIKPGSSAVERAVSMDRPAALERRASMPGTSNEEARNDAARNEAAARLEAERNAIAIAQVLNEDMEEEEDQEDEDLAEEELDEELAALEEQADRVWPRIRESEGSPSEEDTVSAMSYEDEEADEDDYDEEDLAMEDDEPPAVVQGAAGDAAAAPGHVDMFAIGADIAAAQRTAERQRRQRLENEQAALEFDMIQNLLMRRGNLSAEEADPARIILRQQRAAEIRYMIARHPRAIYGGAVPGGVRHLFFAGSSNYDSYFSTSIVRREYADLVPATDDEGLPVQTHLTEYRMCDLHSDDWSKASSFATYPIYLALKILGPEGYEKTVAMNSDEDCLLRYIRAACPFKPGCSRLMSFKYRLLYSSTPFPDSASIDLLKNSSGTGNWSNKVTEVLEVLSKASKNMLPTSALQSSKLTKRMHLYLGEPLLVASQLFPSWINVIAMQYPFLLSYDVRRYHFRCAAFGVDRSVAWLQEQIPARVRGYMAQFNLKRERIMVSREQYMLKPCAFDVFDFHAHRKSMLDILFENEEATGSGPTREFYGMIARDFQRRDVAMWHTTELSKSSIDLLYVHQNGGLFPAPVPAGFTGNLKLFRLLGTVVAKALQDEHLIDLPLSLPFLKIVVNGCRVDEGTLTIQDMAVFYPTLATLLLDLEDLVERQKLPPQFHQGDHVDLSLREQNCFVEDLGLVFSVNSPSRHFQFATIDLVVDGSNVDVTYANAESYLQKCRNLYLNEGIQLQVNAFRDGFNKVFSVDHLRRFTAVELQKMLCGETNLEWTPEDVVRHTVAANGYTKDSTSYLNLVEVMVTMNVEEKKSFLLFISGCTSLPPGGFAGLNPPLTVVKRVDSGDHSFPSVNTCKHFLKLPDYSDIDVLRRQLLTAMRVEGFQMN
ncbi:hypothetical protein L596_028645 [Steinernema carpocapsae]|uniref:E3 ubiquitin-protein ligase n=1 Tax=Steinernema carpocapsae TaxID=34508 RepID=A0A4U5LZ19_STECR|nr:hypothetical protein L596_028645 [Steinernema carpocapsae]